LGACTLHLQVFDLAGGFKHVHDHV
jgi:hypothetical protein